MSLDILTINYNDKNADKLFEESLKNTGFAVIKDHPISSDLINHYYTQFQIQLLFSRVSTCLACILTFVLVSSIVLYLNI